MKQGWKHKWHRVISGTDTKAGRRFDIILLWAIVLSVIIVMFESLPRINRQYYDELFILECIFTGIFTLEYIARVVVAPKRLKYIFSSWGIIDLLSIIPFYLDVLVPGYHYLIVFRLLRLLRVFRILKLLRFIKESQFIVQSLKASVYKIAVFISAVLTLVILLGTLMYVIEGPQNGFTSIPESIYWAIVTITTVGYGDITPQTHIGKIFASLIMLLGYAIIAVPTGIVTVEMARQNSITNLIDCKNCLHTNPTGANFCNNCGEELVKIKGRN